MANTNNNQTPQLSESIDRFVGIATRRYWWVIGTASIIAIGTALGSFLLPDRYKSEATILVQQQQIPERYVVPNSTTDLDEALQAMTHDVLSRPRLLKIITDFNLYPEQMKRLSPEQLVELMRSDITIESLENPSPQQKGANAFTISYIGADPFIVQQVTNQLTALFINEDLQSQQQLDISTTAFLQSQLDAAQADLNTKEQRLRDFKMANLGELPEQQEGNLAILSGLQSDLQNTNSALARANEQHAYLESLLAQYQNLTVATGSVSPAPPVNLSPIDSARAELNRLQNERTSLLATFSPEYPDVKKVDREIAETQALITQLQKAAPVSDSAASNTSAAVPATDTTVAQLKSQLKENQLEIANDTKDIKQLQQQIDTYQHRLNLTPVREQQLTDILRDYDLAKKNYDDLYAKKSQSALATDLQKNQQGQQFRLIEPPNLPSKPFTPNRLKIALGGLAGGIALGAALSFLMEIKDSSLHSEKDLRMRFAVPLMMGTQFVSSPREQRRHAVRATLQWCAGTVLLLAVLAAEYYVYRRG
jgi:polysaccharide chain length determinant protein (PEP-CTERM system associated)